MRIIIEAGRTTPSLNIGFYLYPDGATAFWVTLIWWFLEVTVE